MRGLRRAYGGMPDDITAGEVVRLVAALFPRALPVDDVLRRAGIVDVAARRYGRLSGGQKQRVRFAAAHANPLGPTARHGETRQVR